MKNGIELDNLAEAYVTALKQWRNSQRTVEALHLEVVAATERRLAARLAATIAFTALQAVASEDANGR